MKIFLGFNGAIIFEINKYDTFSFNPTTQVIGIPESFLKNFHKNLMTDDTSHPKFLHTQKDFEFGIYHELSHYRDMMKADKKERSAMKDLLKYIS
jgi:hypothetical protein